MAQAPLPLAHEPSLYAPAAETEARYVAYRAALQAHFRSLRVNATTTTIAGGLLAAHWFSESRELLNLAEPLPATMVIATAWLTFELACLLFYWLGPDHKLYQAVDWLDGFGQDAAVLGLIYLAGPTISPLWAIAISKTLLPALPARASFSQRAVQVSLAFGLCATAFGFDGEYGHAIFTGLCLAAALSAQSVSEKVSEARLQLRAEQDVLDEKLQKAVVEKERGRVARELHDGVAADVTALILRLRREEREGTLVDPSIIEQSQRVLDGLQNVIWSLRQGSGTLDEFTKLLRARCSRWQSPCALVSTLDSAARAAPMKPGKTLELLRLVEQIVSLGTPSSNDSAHMTISTEKETLVIRYAGSRSHKSGWTELVRGAALLDGELHAETADDQWALKLPIS